VFGATFAHSKVVKVLVVKSKLMKAMILYRPNSEHERKVLDYKRDFEYQTGRTVELISLDTREGADFAKIYDITQYPAVVGMADDGQMQRLWQGESMPLINELTLYAREATA